MRKKKPFTGLFATAVAATLVFESLLPASSAAADETNTTAPVETTITKTKVSNPIGGYDTKGNLIYGGDPAVLVDGDTVYLYTGHDTAPEEGYQILEWMCYSTKDLNNWSYEGVVMKADKQSITWANTGTDAWAGQVEKYKGKYYFYYCTWDATAQGKQSIGVAVSDKATGPFVDIGEPLVKGTVTTPESSSWNDIDPTVYIEKDAKGEEHRYLAWGNGKYYICELEESMTKVKDLNGDGKITSGTSTKNADIIEQSPVNSGYTEAPWLYRRKDADGNPTGPYYLFFAYKWREEMAYSTTDDLMNGKWTFGGQLMPPAATSNTNHMAVFDFKGKTYFVYHNGSLPGGSGFRRNACIAEVHFNEDNSIQAIPETAIGITGDTPYTLYTESGAAVSHENFINSSLDGDYPYKKVGIGTYYQPKTEDSSWAIVAGKADPSKDSYVSIQSENKPGLYITVNDDNTVTLAQDSKHNKDASGIFHADADMAKAQTFRTVKGLSNAEAISFESVSKSGYYLCIDGGGLVIKALADCKTDADFYLNTSPKSGNTNTTPKTENDIKTLKIDDQELTKDNKAYHYTVPFTTDSVILTITPEDENGTVTMDGKILGSAGTATIPLKGIKTDVSIDVYAEDGKLKTSYTLDIQKDLTNYVFSAEPIQSYNFDGAEGGAVAVTKQAVPAEKSDANYQYTDGKSGKAIVLDGTYGLKLCSAKGLGESYSISFWMKPDTLGGGVDPTLTAGTFSPEHWLSLTFDTKVWSKANDIYIATEAANAYKENTWQHVALVVDGSAAGSVDNTVTAKLFLDGALISSGDIAGGIMSNANANIYFGVNAWDPYFKGALDDVKIYDKALSDNDIMALSASITETDNSTNPPETDNTDKDDTTTDNNTNPDNSTDTDNNPSSDDHTDTDNNTDTDDNTTEKGKVKKVTITKKNSTKAITKTQTLNKKATLKLAAKVTVTGSASKKVTWKSSNKKIATVSSKGVVKAKSKKGTVTITAASKANTKKKASIKIKVK